MDSELDIPVKNEETIGNKITNFGPIILLSYFLVIAIIVIFFLIGYTQPFQEEAPETACNISIYNENCNAALYCKDKMNINLQCQAHCSQTENFFDDICLRATCASGSPFYLTSACLCVDSFTSERTDYETCQDIMCVNAACFSETTYYSIINLLYPQQFLIMYPFKTSVLGFFNDKPSTTNFLNTGVPTNEGTLGSTTIDEYRRLINAYIQPSDPQYPLWRFIESTDKPRQYWIVWAPYQLFVLSSDANTMMLKRIRNGEYVNDTYDGGEITKENYGLSDDDLYEIGILRDNQIDGKICFIRNKNGYLTNYDFNVYLDQFNGSDSQRWTIRQQPTLPVVNISSSENIEEFKDINVKMYENRMVAYTQDYLSGNDFGGQINMYAENPAIKIEATEEGSNIAYYWGQIGNPDKPFTKFGQIKVYNANFITDGRVINGNGSDNRDSRYFVSDGNYPMKLATSKYNEKYDVEVTPNLDATSNSNPSFAIRAISNPSLFIGRPCDKESVNCWSLKRRAFNLTYSDNTPPQ